METKHTQGKWIVGISYLNDWPVYRIRDMQNPGDPIEVNANARLIASAPELLAALGKLEEYASLTLGEISDQDTGWFYQLQATAGIARAAIAKARGQ